VAGAALAIALPSLVIAVRDALAGTTPGWLARLDPVGLPPVVLGVLLALVGGGLVLAVVVGAGGLLARWAPWFLGPTWRDRLLVAEDRLAREAEHQRLARDLHDGIGHALSVISLQAAAGRRVLAAAPDRAGSSLEVIEQTARAALDDLDQLLATLQEGPAPRRPTPGVADLGRLVATHRALGLDVDLELDPRLGTAALPALVSTTAHQVTAEALANAVRYSAAAPVHVRVALAGAGPPERRVQVRVSSTPDAGAQPRRTGGRGLRGMQQRVALLGGTLTAGPDPGGAWVLAADLPAPERS